MLTLCNFAETIIEISLEKGGNEFHVVPCLNDDKDWVKTLSRWIDEWANIN